MRETARGEEALMQHTTAILVAIQESKAALENQITTLAGEGGCLRDDDNKLKVRVKAETAPQMKELTQKLAVMNNEPRTLTIKVEDGEISVYLPLELKAEVLQKIGPILMTSPPASIRMGGDFILVMDTRADRADKLEKGRPATEKLEGFTHAMGLSDASTDRKKGTRTIQPPTTLTQD
ncbi:hypothetical protein NDU88_005165 [Pleurodeles waltl]|uniref:Uncharacterized protein n=1 Tax=Pleurodeles waltl TaxID=8319 RepID=A0AAV7WXG9_PLEWA|nr:hypothetical protein NDU88_005165 [Pleurodeles waltl]